jgi:hypothetical protein
MSDQSEQSLTQTYSCAALLFITQQTKTKTKRIIYKIN